MNSLEDNSMEIEIQINYICMSPSCSQSTFKFIGIQDVSKHKSCNGWLVKIQDLRNFLMPPSQNSDKLKKNPFDFKGQPLKSLFDINKYFLWNKNQPQNSNSQKLMKNPLYENDPVRVLQQQFNQIRLQIEKELQKTYKEVESRILNVKSVQERTINQIRRILTTIEDNQEVSKQISKSAILKEYQHFCQATDSFTIIDEGKIDKEIFKISQSISSIGNCFWKTELEPVKREKQMFEKAYKEIQTLHSDSSVHPSMKLLSLQKMYEEKNFQTCYSEDKSQAFVKCWVCNNLLFGQGKNIKQRRSSAYENLVNHITTVHFEQTTAKFALQMVKSSTHQLSYDDFLTLLEEKNYEEFMIVDRENVGQNISLIINQKIKEKVLLINVVAMGRQNLAVGKYMVAMSKGKDSADTLMIMVIYAIITSGYYRYASCCGEMKKPKITLFTKDHFAETYQEILKNGFNVQLNVIK